MCPRLKESPERQVYIRDTCQRTCFSKIGFYSHPRTQERKKDDDTDDKIKLFWKYFKVQVVFP